MRTIHHLHIKITDLLALDDCDIFHHCQPHPMGAKGIRAELNKALSHGQIYLVNEPCAETNLDGSCAGHAVSHEVIHKIKAA